MKQVGGGQNHRQDSEGAGAFGFESESDSGSTSTSENIFGFDGGEELGELFGSADTDWKESDALKEIFDENPGFEEDEKYESLPDSGSALLHHDLSNYFQMGLNSKISDEYRDDIEEFSGIVHFEGSKADELEIDPTPWEEQGMDVTHSREDISDAYSSLRENPSSRSDMKVLEEAARDGVPQAPREVVYRAEQVAKAAKAYEDIRGSPKPDVQTELEDAVWAFDKFSGINLEVEEGLDLDHRVEGNEALKFISSTLVQNAYENDVAGDTNVYVEENGDGGIDVTYESRVDDLPEGLGDEIFEYNGDGSGECGGLGLPTSSYIVEKFDGSMDYEGDEDAFRLNYSLQSAE